jgi:hypothetical protein
VIVGLESPCHAIEPSAWAVIFDDLDEAVMGWAKSSSGEWKAQSSSAAADLQPAWIYVHNRVGFGVLEQVGSSIEAYGIALRVFSPRPLIRTVAIRG